MAKDAGITGLVNAICTDMKTSAEDDTHSLGHWRINGRGELVITLRFSQNASLSNNGGDYFFYAVYYRDAYGRGIWRTEDTSCDLDFDWRFPSDLYEVNVDLGRLMEFAAAKNARSFAD